MSKEIKLTLDANNYQQVALALGRLVHVAPYIKDIYLARALPIGTELTILEDGGVILKLPSGTLS